MKRSRSAAARAGWETRRRNAAFERRSAAAFKGWSTRRANRAHAEIDRIGRSGPKHPKPFADAFGVRRYDFRNLSKAAQVRLRDRMLRESVGGIWRGLYVSNSELPQLRARYPRKRKDWRRLVAPLKLGKPIYFRTDPIEVTSSAQLRKEILDILNSDPAAKTLLLVGELL